MAIISWIGNDAATDWSAGASWSGGAKPTDTDSIIIDNSGSAITANVTQSGDDIVDLSTGPNWRGRFGSASTPLYLGACTGKFRFDSPHAGEMYLRVTSLPKVIVENTGASPYALSLINGTYTDVFVNRGTVRIGAAATVTNLYIQFTQDRLGDANVFIESGATITTVYVIGGTTRCEAALTTLNVIGGSWYHQGTTTNNITTVNQHGGSFYFNSKGATITTLNGYSGVFDGSADNFAKTISTATTWRGHRLVTPSNTTISTLVYRGGSHHGVQIPTTSDIASPGR